MALARLQAIYSLSLAFDDYTWRCMRNQPDHSCQRDIRALSSTGALTTMLLGTDVKDALGGMTAAAPYRRGNPGAYGQEFSVLNCGFTS